MARPVKFCPDDNSLEVQLSDWANQPESGYQNLRISQERVTRSLSGLGWADQCREDRGNCCAVVTFTSKRSHADADAAFDFLCELLKSHCETEAGELKIGDKTFPNAVWKTVDPHQQGAVTTHVFLFEVSNFAA